MYVIVVIIYYHSVIFYRDFPVFEDGLSKSMLATMGEGSTSASDLPLYVLGGLFYTSGKETISDDDYNYFGELSNKTDCESGSSFDQYSDASDYESYCMKPEEDQRTVL